MYDTAKKAREAMKSKAKRLAGEKDQKTDSSNWTPAEPLNADVKTGMRPVSRRAYKSGGKVYGEACAPRMDRKPRKSGGMTKAKSEAAEEKSEAVEIAKAKINRNVKDANQEREGIKHIGGMKKGGRAKKNNGGGNGSSENTQSSGGLRDRIRGILRSIHPGEAETQRRQLRDVGSGQSSTPSAEDREGLNRLSEESGMKKGGRAKRKDGGKAATTLAGQEKIEKYERDLSKPSRGKAEQYKKGGKAQRAKGGPVAGAEEMMKSAAETSGVPSSTMSFTGVKKGALSPLRGLKRGGKAKKEGTGKLGGGPISDASLMAGTSEMFRRGSGKDKGGRAERKAGGRTRAKAGTKINIMIAAGKPAGAADMMPPPGPMGGPPPGIPIPMPGDGGGMPPAMPPMPPPMPAPGGAPPMGAPAGLPMPRKTGGRVAKYYGGEIGDGSDRPEAQMGGPQMAGGMRPVGIGGGQMGGGFGGGMMGGFGTPGGFGFGFGRGNPPMRPGNDAFPPPNTPIRPGADAFTGGMGGAGGHPPVSRLPMPPVAAPMARKTGGRVTKKASSYKDMEAGSGGGEGRLQKTDIAEKGKDAPKYRRGGKVYKSYKDMDAGAGSGEGRMEKTEIQSRKK